MHNLECPYCQNKTELHMDSSIVYGKDYGPIHLCVCYPICDSYVGCHPGTTTPLGRPANKELRYWKKQAHEYFDHLWKTKKINGIYKKFIPDTSNRKKSYIWLSEQLGLPEERTHIGMFDVKTCKKVVEICKVYYNE